MKAPIVTYVKSDDPWVKIFVDFLRPLCDNNELKLERLIEITGWDPLKTPWGPNLPFYYLHKSNQKTYIILKEGKDIG